jgi:anthranilate/para-aminobenzoate synthase component II
MKNENIYVMGICLGHQIMARAHGHVVKKSKAQMHGQSVEIFFNGISTRVQRYNSLAVFSEENEINICEYKNAISYQFHPESVGTLQNDLFFYDLLKFIKL